MALELISFGLGANWIIKLYKKLKSIRGNRKVELNKVNDFLYNDPLELVKYYVEPDCQEINPADRHEQDFLTSRESIFKKIGEFQKPQNFNQAGNNQMFILSDAGMGKTSLLAMLKLLHIVSIWPKNIDFVLEKLGKGILDKIGGIKDKRQTFLLLDALDEDPMALSRIKERLLEILNATKSFHRVIITCRTQFFPKIEAEPLERPGLIKIGGYVCPAKYISLFNDEKIDSYLKKRFSNKFQKKKIEEAKRLISKMGSLRCRPLLLSYIDKLMESPLIQDKINKYSIYNALVDSWLIREEEKTKISYKKLLIACEILAFEMYKKGIRDISESDLDFMIEKIPELKEVKAINIKGRSLLNRNSGGHYRFSHYSIQEYLVVRYFAENSELRLKNKLRLTDFIWGILVENIREVIFALKNFNLKGANLQGAKLWGGDLVGAYLFQADLQKAKLRGAKLREANLYEAKLVEADLYRADLRGAKLAGADLRGAELEGAKLEGANLNRANMYKADLEGANLMGVDLRSTNLQGAKLRVANLQKSNLNMTDLRGTELYRANLVSANLQEANLQKTDLEGANLSGANLQGTNFKWAKLCRTDLVSANLQGANLQETDLSGANLSGADLQRVNLYLVNLTGANLQGANLQKTDLNDVKLAGADLRRANLEGSKLRKAKLHNANLRGANLQKTDLSGANLVGADLREANIKGANLSSSDLYNAVLFGANLEGANLMGANLEDAIFLRAILRWANLERAKLLRTNLQDANLFEAKLQGANLEDANFSGADLQRANLKNADLRYASFYKAIGLTVVMLLEVRTLFMVKHLDSELEKKLKAIKPELWNRALPPGYPPLLPNLSPPNSSKIS